MTRDLKYEDDKKKKLEAINHYPKKKIERVFIKLYPQQIHLN